MRILKTLYLDLKPPEGSQQNVNFYTAIDLLHSQNHKL